MGTLTDRTGSIVVSALSARANFGKLLDRAPDERGSLVIEKRGTRKAMLGASVNTLGWRPRNRKFCASSGESKRNNGTNKMTQRQIDQEIKAYRMLKKKR